VTGLQVATGLQGIPTATVKLMGPDGVERYVACTGTGPVDAVYKAIDQIMGVSVALESFALNSVSEGIEALATTRVVIKPVPGGPNDSLSISPSSGGLSQRKFSGSGSDTDIITSSARAYVSALNKLLTWNMRRKDLVILQDTNGVGNAEPAAPMSVAEVSP
jgi:2-isopropylmalate synthase